MVTIPNDLQDIINTLIAGTDPDIYNSYVARKENVTSVSASGRVMLGWQEVCDATVKVFKGTARVSGRYINIISFDQIGDVFYVVLKTGADEESFDGSVSSIDHIVTLLLEKSDDNWKLLHRHNTRTNRS